MAVVGVGVKDVLHTRHDLHVYSVGLSPYNGGCSAVPLDSCGWWLRMRKDDRKQPQFIVYYYYKCVYCDELNVWMKERLEIETGDGVLLEEQSALFYSCVYL